MKYDDDPRGIQSIIDEKLNEIEEKLNVRILHAVESGSRSWGFASPDSDYDVRFIYVRPMEDYLRLDEMKDTITWELNETLDIVGWDISKVLRLMHRSNVTLFEWANSPAIYRTTMEWQRIYEGMERFFSVKASMYQYYGVARSTFEGFLQEEKVKYKKYFYAIRPLLACKWIDEKKCPPPVLFSKLRETMLPQELEDKMEQLLVKKMAMSEGDKGPQVEEIHCFLEETLEHYKSYIADYKEEKNMDFETVNQLFRACIRGELK